MKLLESTDERLRQPTHALKGVDPEIADFVRRLGNLMLENKGIGIAAPQVGSTHRLFLVDGRVIGKVEPIVFINPELLILSDETDAMVEGCLSCPGVEKEVQRSKSVVCRARDINFDWFEVDSNGLYARVIQHEYDHLYGRLIADL